MKKAATSPWRPKRWRWIAKRVLVRSDAVGGRVLVRVGIPEIDRPDTNWRCPFLIEGLEDDSIRYGRGEDSMSALQNSLSFIRCILEQSGVPLRCEGFPEDLTLFPKHIPWEYGLAFYKRIEKMVEAEVAAETERVILKRRARREAQRKARAKARTK